MLQALSWGEGNHGLGRKWSVGDGNAQSTVREINLVTVAVLISRPGILHHLSPFEYASMLYNAQLINNTVYDATGKRQDNEVQTT